MIITFKKVELKAFPHLELIAVGMNVLALENTDYEGLKGVITEIKYGEEKETENETILDITVTFEENDNESVESSHPHLNGTSICDVICGEDELGFQFNVQIPFYQTADGKVVCPHCYKAVERVTETQSDDIAWSFEDGKYVKEEVYPSSTGKRCDSCDGVLEDNEETVFVY